MARLTIQRLETIGTISETSAASGQHDFEQLVALHEPRIRRLTHRLLGWRNPAELEDIVQDVLLTALEKLDRFRGDANVATWLTRVTINRVRTQRRRRLLSLRWFHRSAPTAACLFAEGSDHDAVRDETSIRVRGAVQQLPAPDREVIVLFHLEGHSIAEIAKLVDAKPNAVEVRLHRARRRLKASLGDLMED